LRHRRRYSTQTITRKKFSEKQNSPAPQKQGKFFAWFLKFVLIVLLTAGAYFITVNYIWPALSAPQPIQKSNAVKKQSQPVVEKQKPADQKPAQTYTRPARRIQIEILNGCGQQGIANKLADQLSDKNYDVVNKGNYLEKGKIVWDVAHSKIINHLSAADEAEDLAGLIGIDDVYIETFNSGTPVIDLTIVIGRDFSELKIFR